MKIKLIKFGNHKEPIKSYKSGVFSKVHIQILEGNTSNIKIDPNRYQDVKFPAGTSEYHIQQAVAKGHEIDGVTTEQGNFGPKFIIPEKEGNSSPSSSPSTGRGSSKPDAYTLSHLFADSAKLALAQFEHMARMAEKEGKQLGAATFKALNKEALKLTAQNAKALFGIDLPGISIGDTTSASPQMDTPAPDPTPTPEPAAPDTSGDSVDYDSGDDGDDLPF